MKKILTTLAAVLCCAAMFSSCNKDNPNPEPADGWVDLGLPSGLLWAACNLGADSPEGYGDYFAWSETATKRLYDWSTYRYCTVDAEGELATLTKYNISTDYGTVDNLTTLDAVDDAAAVRLGNGVRIPTMDEWIELAYNTTTEWTTQNGVAGYRLTASNGNSLFLPAAGFLYGSDHDCADSSGHYWSASLDTDIPYGARYFYFDSEDWGEGSGYRFSGASVRAVKKAN